jgi:hypothetical protein
MLTYFEIPEAVDHVAGQAWLSPDEGPPRVKARHSPMRKLSFGEALSEIAAIVRRIGRS